MRIERYEMYLQIAQVVAKRGTCERLQVGAVIIKDARVISMGYNGNVSGAAHCVHQDDEPCHTAVHAEANSIAFAARNGVPTDGASIAVTHQPCMECAKLIINSGIVKVIYEKPYRRPEGLNLLLNAGVFVVRRMQDGQFKSVGTKVILSNVGGVRRIISEVDDAEIE